MDWHTADAAIGTVPSSMHGWLDFAGCSRLARDHYAFLRERIAKQIDKEQCRMRDADAAGVTSDPRVESCL